MTVAVMCTTFIVGSILICWRRYIFIC